MKRILASELKAYTDQKVQVEGWLNNARPFGKILFLILRDRTGLIQIVIQDKTEAQKISSLQPGSILSIEGKAIASTQAALGVEIIDPIIAVKVEIKDPPPLEYYKPEIPSDLEFILDHRPIALRNRQIQAVFKIQAGLAHSYRLFMHDEVQAVEYFAPNMIGASSEGGAEFFNVDYFGYTATLAQSSQLYKQMMVGVNERVFALMPFFRAERSHTPRHLSEGKQFEFEMGFFETWHEILDIQERCLKFMIDYLHKHHAHEIELLGGNIVKAPMQTPFPRITFQEAQQLFFERTGIDEREEPDLSPAAERELCRYAYEQSGTDFIFITDWKTEKRPFYAFPKENTPTLTNTFDLLCAGTEITSGGQRRHTYKSMVEGILSKQMDPATFEDYLSIFKYGMPPHGGFGMGLERLTMTVLKLKNIREASLFPSDPKRIAGIRLKAKIFYGEENVRNEIIRLLKQHDVDFKQLPQDQMPSQLAIKSLMLKGKNTKKNYQVNIAAHKKVDMKAIAEKVGEKCEFETEEIIKERFGLKPTAIPPFGQLLNVETFFDQEIASQDICGFVCGLSSESILMPAKDLIAIVQPTMGLFTKE